MSGRPWRGAIIGCGFFAPNHMHAWASIPSVEIVALCDRDLAKARTLSRQFNVNDVYGDAEEMMRRAGVDFIDIITTAGSHRQLVELGARHRKAVICQKPFAETLEDADAMVGACRRVGVPLLVHENFRWQRPFIELAARMSAGVIGQVASLALTFRHAYDIYRGQPYLAQAERLAIMDVGLHLFDLARRLMGDVRQIVCHTRRLNPIVRGEDAFDATLEHTSGAVSTVGGSFFHRQEPDLFPQTLAVATGTEGSLEIAPGYRLIERRRTGTYEASVTREISVEPAVPPWGEKPWHAVQDSVVNFHRHAVDVFDGRAEPQPSGAHNRETLALALAAYESASRASAVDMTDSEWTER